GLERSAFWISANPAPGLPLPSQWRSLPGRVRALRVRQLEAALELLVARVLERGERAGVVGELLAPHRAAPADLAGFTHQRPAAEQVELQHQLHEARRVVAVGALLQEQAHGAGIVRLAGAGKPDPGFRVGRCRGEAV